MRIANNPTSMPLAPKAHRGGVMQSPSTHRSILIGLLLLLLPPLNSPPALDYLLSISPYNNKCVRGFASATLGGSSKDSGGRMSGWRRGRHPSLGGGASKKN